VSFAVGACGYALLMLVAVGNAFSSGDDVVEADRKSRAIEERIASVPGVSAVRVLYQNNWVTKGDLSADVTAEPGSDLSLIADEVEEALWLSDIEVVQKVGVIVHEPGADGSTRAQEVRSYAQKCDVYADGAWCRGLDVLEDRYGDRPD
jgi:hypothetical protein